MKVHLYDSDGYYLGSRNAQKDPLNKGKFLTPRLSTQITPPLAAENEIQKFVDNAWQLVPSYKGQVWFTEGGEPMLINNHEVEPDLSWTNEQPVPVLPDPTYRQLRLEDIIKLSPEQNVVAAFGDSLDVLFQAMLSVLDPVNYPPSEYTRDFMKRVQDIHAIQLKHPKN